MPTNTLDSGTLLDAVAADTVHSRLMHQLLSLNLYLVAERLGLALERATRLAETYDLLLDQAIARAPAADQARRESLQRDLAQAATPALTPIVPPGHMSGREAQELARVRPVADPRAAGREAGLRNEIERLDVDRGPELAELAAQADRLRTAPTSARHTARGIAETFTPRPAPGNHRTVRILALEGGIGLLRHASQHLQEVGRLARLLDEANDTLRRTVGTSELILRVGVVGAAAKQWAGQLADSLSRTVALCRSRGRDCRLNRFLALDRAYRLVPRTHGNWRRSRARHRMRPRPPTPKHWSHWWAAPWVAQWIRCWTAGRTTTSRWSGPSQPLC